MRTSIIAILILVLSCSPSEEDRRQKQQAQDLEQKVGWLRHERDPALLRSALGSVIFYCQEKAMVAACRELQYQLVWGGATAIDLIAADPAIGTGRWNGKVPRVLWQVAYETASTDDGERALRRAYYSYGARP